jgi:subtilase family serine protease
MRKKIVYLSIGAAVLLILTSLSSVIGLSSLQSSKDENQSPLFAIRTAQSTNELQKMTICSTYLGKGRTINIFSSSQLSVTSQLDKVVQSIANNPSLVKRIYEKISDSPQMIRLLKNYGLSGSQVKQSLSQVIENPEMLRDQLKDADVSLSALDGPKPLGLSTSSALGCFIVVLALLPLALLFGIVISTILIITCLNIGGCAETIISAILAGFVQELTQP